MGAALWGLTRKLEFIAGRSCWARLRAKERAGPKGAVAPPWSGGRTVDVLYVPVDDIDPNAAKWAVSSSLRTDAHREIRTARSSGDWATAGVAVPLKARKSPFGSKPTPNQ